MSTELLSKYNVAGPRYTSYPTVPYWDHTPEINEWLNAATQTYTLNGSKMSLYIHLPFCESLCTYCGCNTRITVNHAVEEPYINAVLNEWKIYTDHLQSRPIISELHLGGGTPTFFSAKNLKKLIDGIFMHADKDENYEFGFEGHPANTTREHLQTLFNLGFKRVSFGIQDFDIKVQEAINRHQSIEEVKTITSIAREIGYTSINYDLVYGLPFQTSEGLGNTIDRVIKLKPDRIAFYSYAHVPWMKPGQRKYSEKDLPDGEIKRNLYESSRASFENAGYVEIGMDHFALREDDLYKSSLSKTLHRNFMGYTTQTSELLIGLGVSSISDARTCFIQNVKVVEEYTSLVNSGKLPFFRGHLLNDEDLILRQHILNIMCRFVTSWEEAELQHPVLAEILPRLGELEKDKLIRLTPFHLKVTEAGRPFVRNICMAFDARLWRKEPVTALFSKTV